MFDNYQPLYGQLGGAMPMAGTENGAGQFIQPNYGDLGFNGGQSAQNNDFLKSLGYTGGDPYQTAGASYSPEFLQFLQGLRDKGITLQQGPDPTKQGNNLVRAIDANGNQVGGQYQQYLGNNDAFGVGVGAMSLFGGLAAAGVGAAGAGGAAADAGGLAGTGLPAYAAPETYGSALTASAEPGFGGALGGEAAAGDLGAFEGIGSGVGGSGAAASGGGAAGGGLMSNLGDLGSWAQKNPGLVNMGGNAVNALIGAYTGQKALGRQTDATNQANALWAPYRETGTNALGRINGLMQNPSSITQDPGYQFGMNQGVQARDRSAASQGGLYSGATQKALTRYGQDYAGTKLNDAYARYGNVAQLGATGTTNMSNNLTNLGQAGAGAAMYQGNVANNAVNNALGQWNFSNSGYGVPWNQSQYGKPPGG